MKHNNYKKFEYKLNFNNNDDKTVIIKFSQCYEKYPLQELKDFISFAKKFESISWRTIKTYSGLKIENIPEIKEPNSIDKDITLSSIRITQRFRLIGYRQEQYFYIVWFDKNHLVYKG